VTSGKIATDAVGSTEITDLAIATADLANQSVTTTKLADLAVTSAKLADNSVTNAKMADNAVGSAEVTDHSLSSDDIGVLAGTVSIDPPNLRRYSSSTTGVCAMGTATVTGIQAGDQVILSAPTDLNTAVLWQSVIQPTANTLTVRFCNYTTVDNIDDTARTWGYIVTR